MFGTDHVRMFNFSICTKILQFFILTKTIKMPYIRHLVIQTDSKNKFSSTSRVGKVSCRRSKESLQTYH